MSDINFVNREHKKSKLKEQMLTQNQMDEAAVKIARMKKIQKKRRTRIITLVSILVLTILGSGGYYYFRNYQYQSHEIRWAIDIPRGSLVGYEDFASGVIKYSKDGATYIDGKGNNIWTESYQMEDPMVAVNDEFVAFATKKGTEILICNSDGKQGIATTVLPIGKIEISANGIVVALLEDASSSYISFYDKSGNTLDIAVKTIMGGDGYPIDFSLSEDGTQLMCSFLYISGGKLLSRVVFYDFSEIGKNVPKRLVGGFDDPFVGTLVGVVEHLGSHYTVAAAGNGLTFFSVRNLASPQIVEEALYEEQVRSVFTSKEYVGVVVENLSGEFPYQLMVYGNSGGLLFEKMMDYEYEQADIDDNIVILYNENSCKIYNLVGVEKYSGTFDFPVRKISKGSSFNTLLVMGENQIQEIVLK